MISRKSGMEMKLLRFVYIIGAIVALISASEYKKPTVLITILVRNKAHTLPYFLTYLEQLHYPKDRMHLWIRSDNNIDNSVEILSIWLKNQGDEYHGFDVNLDETISIDKFGISQWTRQRFLHVINLREQALNAGGNMWADFIWMLDADVFLTNPDTLDELVSKNRTVVAPMLKSDGLYSNFWAGMTNDYYYLRTDRYEPIFYREEKGCFNVPMIHSAVLIDLRRRVSDSLTYDPNNLKAYDGPTDDIITFAVGANMSDIPLFICNDHFYGFVMVPLEETETIADDEQRLINIKTEILSNSNYLPLSTYLEQFVQYPEKDTLGVDHVYMINLLRRPERRDRMHKLFRELGIKAETMDAVDGRALNNSIIKELGIEMMPEYADPYHDRPMTMGEVGCFLSHYNIWGKVIENGYESVIVLEDDVRFEPYFRQKIKYILAELDNLQVQWDLIYLGRKILAGNSESLVHGSKYLVRASYSYWTLGYILSGNGAKKLVGGMPLKHLIPVDEYLPILADVHPREDWKIYYPKRNLILLSASPLLIYPTHYTGEQGYISDTENSSIIFDSQSVTKSKREDL